jgi:hypothetical protein
VRRKKNISNLLVGVFLVAVYCHVLFIQVICSFPHIVNLAGAEQDRTQKHDQHHGTEAIPAIETYNQDNHHNNESNKDDNCCNDETAAFFASQTTPTNISFDYKNTCFTGFIGFSNSIFIKSNLSVNNDLEGYFFCKSPPPKIPDIRVFTHSFLI